MSQYILVKDEAIKLSIESEDCINQLINAYLMNNINKDIETSIGSLDTFLDTSFGMPLTSIIALAVEEYGLDVVNEAQAMAINKKQHDFKDYTKLQTVINLMFESNYLIITNAQFEIEFTDKFYYWFDQQILGILLETKETTDDLLLRIARKYSHDNKDSISKQYLQSFAKFKRNASELKIPPIYNTFH